MPDPQDIERWKQGKDVWNIWAQQMLKRKEELQTAGWWKEENDRSAEYAETQKWLDEASVDFSNHHFEEDTDFSGWIFPGAATFLEVQFSGGVTLFVEAEFSGAATLDKAQFSGEAGFSRAQFSGASHFTGAQFSGSAYFGEAQFGGEAAFDRAEFSGLLAWFDGAQFGDYAYFGEAQFGGDANFERSTIEKSARFSLSQFNASANFHATRSQLSFSLADASFERVPDFVEASFSEPPRLDNLTVKVRPIWKRRDRDSVARWRKLRAMALSGHDHEQEMEFFAQETRARRIWRDRPWHAQFWFGGLYDLFSNFGRSYLRPVFWWLISFFGFAVF